MINKIEAIRNFKSLESLNDLELKKLTLISGKNNIGKTNLLEALFFMHDRLNVQSLIRLQNFRGINIINAIPENVFAPIFYDYDLHKEIELQLIRDNLSESLSIKYNSDFKSYSYARNIKEFKLIPESTTANNQIPSASLEFIYKLAEKEEERFHLYANQEALGIEKETEVNSKITKVIYISSRTFNNPSENALRYGELDIKGKTAIVLETLRMIDERIKAISTVETGLGSQLYADFGLKNKLPVNMIGDGVTRLLTIILAIMVNQEGIVLIDEIENGFHYSVYRNVFKIISKVALEANCQIIMTTHNKELIVAACESAREYEDDFKFIRLERNKQQVLVAKEFTYENLTTALEYQMEVR